MTMPFGRHKGRDVEDLPTDYLEWLLENVQLLSSLMDAVLQTLDQRTSSQRRRGQAATVVIQVRPEEVKMVRQVFDLGYRAAARSLHPDVGGDPEEMVRLNKLAESVRSQLQAVVR